MQPELIGGRYRVESSAGRGGMGTVWRCVDESLHRVVAVKQVGLLPNESVTDSARAFREARSLAGLNDRNVVTVFDVIEQDDQIWLVMEYVPGRSLSQIIREDGPLGPRDAADIGAQVAEGLAAAHAAGIIHRDVKPGNVLVREDGVAKISDFGIARAHGDPALTQSGFLTGTPTYFSPQLARGGEPGPMDDVWALGATLYAAVEDRPLFEQHPNPVAVLHAIASGRARAPERAGFLAPALHGMLAVDPEERWSMADAGRQLGELATRHAGDSVLVPTRELANQRQPEAQPQPQPQPETLGAPAAAPAPRLEPSVPAADRGPTQSSRSRDEHPGLAPRRTRRGWLVVGAGIVLLLAALVWALTPFHAGPSGQASSSGTGNQPSSTTSTTGPPSKSPSPSPSQDTGQSPSSSPPTSAAAGSAAAQEAFVRDYYAAAPGGTDRAWAMLGPGEKAQGRGSYDGFWRTIRTVDVRSAVARPDSSSVDVTLVYRTTNGGTSTERKREGLIPDGNGGYLLQSDVPAG